MKVGRCRSVVYNHSPPLDGIFTEHIRLVLDYCTAVIGIEIEKTKNLGTPPDALSVIEDRNSSGSR